jgi:hypothetical protein
MRLKKRGQQAAVTPAMCGLRKRFCCSWVGDTLPA